MGRAVHTLREAVLHIAEDVGPVARPIAVEGQEIHILPYAAAVDLDCSDRVAGPVAGRHMD